MTSKTSNLNNIELYLQQQKGEYKDLTINKDEIVSHLNQLEQGNGLRILNSLDANSLGIFIFYCDGYKILVDNFGESKLHKISDDVAEKLMQRYYICRFLSQ